ncbi:ATP-binding cassette domain-containing protein [Neobacillus novalis]|uniref:ATP-binding cassette domain-containing protein n=1 Tax=Neobacillus novalis TaxID=220687 RepID=A0AA95SBG5_9BACI|nr:ATP-binding cassette domain-containing protein [Neobacillus novalis]WHY86519.1 ATP-binding cassette domain-containing protein [Neobacillus novalis]
MDLQIEVKEVSKESRNSKVLDHITLQLKKGKTYGFVGYNGSGKTMLFKAICGLTRITSGTIKVNGKFIGKDVDFIENTGVIIESPEFMNGLTGPENLKLLAEIQNKINEKEILHYFQMVGLGGHEKKKVSKYSLGMKQRLRIAQAIMEDPEILILDEPFNGLDKRGVEEIHKLLLEYKISGKTILLTSHHEGDIELLCDEVFELDKGRIFNHKVLSNKKTKGVIKQ